MQHHSFPESPYTYEPLEDAATHIRIVEVAAQRTTLEELREAPQCVLKAVAIKQKPKYTALSYSLGDEGDQKPIVLDGKRKLVTKNLYDFLQQAILDLHDAHATSKSYWIDALPTDQSDQEEKKHQVAMMGDIYMIASTVQIYLGPADEDTHHAFDFLGYLAKGQASVDPQRSGILQIRVGLSVDRRLTCIRNHYDETLGPLRALLKRRWWRRLWVQQEVGLPKPRHIFLRCGILHLRWVKVVLANDAILSTLKYAREVNIAAGQPRPTRPQNVIEELDWCWSRMRQTCINGYAPATGKDKVENLTMAHRLSIKACSPDHRLEASLPVDHVYAIVSISSDMEWKTDFSASENSRRRWQTLLNTRKYLLDKSDYSNADPEGVQRQLRFNVAKYLLDAFGTYTLGLCNGVDAQPPSSLPTWVPDVSVETLRFPISTEPPAKSRFLGSLGLQSPFLYEFHNNHLLLQAKKVDTLLGSPNFPSIPAHNKESAGDYALAWLRSYAHFLAATLEIQPGAVAGGGWRLPICNRTPTLPHAQLNHVADWQWAFN
ncbi:uncharacterized protein LTR77_000889 [Saxophila tyrrhenica]|uniref:Heterokaryon incompatibility domain-containing protein n=1 Tax=Saxophila tyrrhenica TaxID=1690608 RepID=A0AAV9PSL4_9PEZI|nr:hypothetical protein LTR77_000889 [Saxophila tyrrhenica]